MRRRAVVVTAAAWLVALATTDACSEGEPSRVASSDASVAPDAVITFVDVVEEDVGWRPLLAPPDVESIVVACNDAGDADVDSPIECAPAPSPRCLDAAWALQYRELNWTCDPGGACSYEPVVTRCFWDCENQDGGVSCAQFETP